MTEKINKCPRCYRNLGIWQKDPILLPKGLKYKWEDDTTLIEETDPEKAEYKGIYQIGEEIIELQDYLKDIELENFPEEERTEFSPINKTGFFQIKGIHIKEMRESVEKLLIVSEQNLQDFLNYDEGGNHIDHPDGDKTEWTDNVVNEEDWDKFQVKAIHIEELRHYIAINDVIGFFRGSEPSFEATWTRTKKIVTIARTSHGINSGNIIQIYISSDTAALPAGSYMATKLNDNEFTVEGLDAGASSGTCTYSGWYVYKFADTNEYKELNKFSLSFREPDYTRSSFATDTRFFYYCRLSTVYSDMIIKMNKNGESADLGISFPFRIRDIAVDDNYIWALAHSTLGEFYEGKEAILKFDKNNMAIWEVWTLFEWVNADDRGSIVCDKNYLYLFIPSIPAIPVYKQYNFIKINKETKEEEIRRNHTDTPFIYIPFPYSGIGIDKDYIYVRAIYRTGSGETQVDHIGIMKLTKSFGFGGWFEILSTSDVPYPAYQGCVVAGTDNLYIIGNRYEGKLWAYDKSGSQKWEIEAYLYDPVFNVYPLATVAEYSASLVE